LGGFGWFWVVLGGFGWFWVVLDGFGGCRDMTNFTIYFLKNFEHKVKFNAHPQHLRTCGFPSSGNMQNISA